jgi:hypothetical protein
MLDEIEAYDSRTMAAEVKSRRCLCVSLDCDRVADSFGLDDGSFAGAFGAAPGERTRRRDSGMSRRLKLARDGGEDRVSDGHVRFVGTAPSSTRRRA